MTTRYLTRARPAPKTPQRIRGWLLAYVIALAILLLHGLGLTVAAIIIYANPSVAGLHTFIPLGPFLFYVITNLIAALYTIVLFSLMHRRRHAAIAHNIIFGVLTALFVISWHFLGEKSSLGTLIDALPGLVGLCYFLVSKRVRNTFTLR
jgi:hypothetical protein